jgi:hypothetical protein
VIVVLWREHMIIAEAALTHHDTPDNTGKTPDQNFKG